MERTYHTNKKTSDRIERIDESGKLDQAHRIKALKANLITVLIFTILGLVAILGWELVTTYSENSAIHKENFSAYFLIAAIPSIMISIAIILNTLYRRNDSLRINL